MATYIELDRFMCINCGDKVKVLLVNCSNYASDGHMAKGHMFTLGGETSSCEPTSVCAHDCGHCHYLIMTSKPKHGLHNNSLPQCYKDLCSDVITNHKACKGIYGCDMFYSKQAFSATTRCTYCESQGVHVAPHIDTLPPNTTNPAKIATVYINKSESATISAFLQGKVCEVCSPVNWVPHKFN
jgi:hypothetical protein